MKGYGFNITHHNLQSCNTFKKPITFKIFKLITSFGFKEKLNYKLLPAHEHANSFAYITSFEFMILQIEIDGTDELTFLG